MTAPIVHDADIACAHWICVNCFQHYETFEEFEDCFRSHKEVIIGGTMVKDETSKKPVHKIRVSGVTVTFWENTGEKGKYLSAGIERSYKDAKGEWQTSNSYMTSDLDKLALAVSEAQRYANIEYPASKKE